MPLGLSNQRVQATASSIRYTFISLANLPFVRLILLSPHNPFGLRGNLDS